MKIYTRSGDSGETSLLGGIRVSKTDPRVDAYGEVDEVNAWLGFVRASRLEAYLDGMLEEIQRDLFAVGAQVADPNGRTASRMEKAVLGDADIARLESWIDRLDADLPRLVRFILPGGTSIGAALHLARTVCRRAERRIVALQPPVDPILVRYVNRLSDLLFVMARSANHRTGADESEW